MLCLQIQVWVRVLYEISAHPSCKNLASFKLLDLTQYDIRVLTEIWLTVYMPSSHYKHSWKSIQLKMNEWITNSMFTLGSWDWPKCSFARLFDWIKGFKLAYLWMNSTDEWVDHTQRQYCSSLNRRYQLLSEQRMTPKEFPVFDRDR